jgi:hypothetical protein
MVRTALAFLLATMPRLTMAYSAMPPAEGYVPSADVAERVAIDLLIPIYGQDEVRREMPYSVTRKGDVWIVRGTVKEVPGVVHFGHPLEIWISKATGQVVRLEEEK